MEVEVEGEVEVEDPDCATAPVFLFPDVAVFPVVVPVETPALPPVETPVLPPVETLPAFEPEEVDAAEK